MILIPRKDRYVSQRVDERTNIWHFTTGPDTCPEFPNGLVIPSNRCEPTLADDLYDSFDKNC